MTPAFPQYRRNFAALRIYCGDINIKHFHPLRVIERPASCESHWYELLQASSDKLRNPLGFAIRNREEPHAHGSGPVACKEYSLSVRRPADQAVISRMLYQLEFALPIGRDQEDVMFRSVLFMWLVVGNVLSVG